MGIFTDVEKSNEKHKKEVEQFLLQDEQLKEVFSLVLDYVAVTDNRLILVDSSMTSSKKFISSIPYSKMTSVHLAKGGFMKISKELKVCVGSEDYSMSLLSSENALKLYRYISRKLME